MRHGQSAGNVARDDAEASGAPLIDIDHRDVDVPLSELGRQQSMALREWFAARPTEEQPTVVLCSPYVRAMETAALVWPDGRRIVDERLREKELGALDRLTRRGIIEKFPHEAEQYARLGKFYYRPPGGESWCDVILRLRSLLDDFRLQHCDERVLVVAHQVIVLCFRYLLEEMTEQEILAIDRAKDVANCSVTTYALGTDDDASARLVLEGYDFVAPLVEGGAPVTHAPEPTRPR